MMNMSEAYIKQKQQHNYNKVGNLKHLYLLLIIIILIVCDWAIVGNRLVVIVLDEYRIALVILITGRILLGIPEKKSSSSEDILRLLTLTKRRQCMVCLYIFNK